MKLTRQEMKLTDNFTVEEFQNSATAKKYMIDNTIPREYMNNVYNLACVLLNIRDEYGLPIVISSGYRCPVLNLKVGGVHNSLHCTASAADIKAKNPSDNIKLWRCIDKLIKSGKLQVRSLIWEYGTKKNPRWIHIDINDGKHTNRKNHYVYYYDK